MKDLAYRAKNGRGQHRPSWQNVYKHNWGFYTAFQDRAFFVFDDAAFKQFKASEIQKFHGTDFIKSTKRLTLKSIENTKQV